MLGSISYESDAWQQSIEWSKIEKVPRGIESQIHSLN